MSTTALKFLTTATGTAGLYLFYDYKTCHPMRQLKYDPQEAVVRFHNTLVRRLPTSAVAMNILPANQELSLQELDANFNGQNGKPMYFSAAGTIYDASTSPMFQSTYSQWAGKDATVALARMSLDKKDINRTDVWKDLTDREEQSLQSWIDYFDEKYYIRGRLKEYKCADKEN